MKLPGVLHDHVVHMKKRKLVKGKDGKVKKDRNGKAMYQWIKPRYTRVVRHELSPGKSLYVKAGTQIIDRAWSHMRTYLRGHSSKVGSQALQRRIRFGQWSYWHRGHDLWLELGKAL